MEHPLIVERESQLGTLSLHPLVLINISDSWTRARIKTKDKNPRVIGCLMGVQRGRDVEIFNSFELVYTVNAEGKMEIDQAFLTARKELFAQPYPTYDILGYYLTTSGLTPADLELNDQFHDVVDSPLVLVLDPLKAVPTAKRLPVDIYEAEIRAIDNKPRSVFAHLTYKIETGESERIAVDHIAHVRPVADGDSVLAAHLEGVQSAIQMLNLRVRNIQKFVDATLQGKVKKDHHLLRQISAMANMLPTIDSEDFRQEFLSEFNDSLLVTYLATVTKSCQLADDLSAKFSAAYGDKQKRRGGGGGGGGGMLNVGFGM
jgi:COP9 signalosome complex subunit 6